MIRQTLSCCFVLSLALSCAPPTSSETCKGRVVGDLVITEVLNDPAGTDSGKEWFEVFNASLSPIDLKGTVITLSAPDGSGEKKHTIRAGTVNPGQYFTMGDVRSGPNPDYIGYSYADGLGAMPNGGLKLKLSCGSLVIDETTISKPAVAEKSWQLNGNLTIDATANDNQDNFCASPNLHSSGSYSSPQAANPPCAGGPVMGTCLDNGSPRLVVAPAPGALFVSEIMADPNAVADTAGEWIELHALEDVDLNGLTIRVGTSKSTITSADCVRIGADTQALLAHGVDAATNGGLPPVNATFTAALPQAGATIEVLAGETLIDGATYGQAVSGVSAQLNPDMLNATANDEASNFCAGTTAIGAGGDKGTPGAPNTACPTVVPMGTCLENGNSRAVVTPMVGQLFVSEIMADPTVVADTAGEWIEVHATADVDLNGLTVRVGTGKKLIDDPNCVRVAANSDALLAHNTDSTVNGNLPKVAATFTASLPQAGATIFIEAADAGIDSATYGQAIAGVSWQLNPLTFDAVSNDVATNFCASTTVRGTEKGTPGAPNTACPTPLAPGQCVDPTTTMPRAIITPGPGDLVIAEVMNDPKGDSSGNEWFEVYVKKDVDLNGLLLRSPSMNQALAGTTCVPVVTGSSVLFAKSFDPTANGGLPAVTATFSFALANTGLTLSVESDAGVVDTATLPNTTTATKGFSKQLSVNMLDATMNDVATAFCPSPGDKAYGPDTSDGGVDGGSFNVGTPGAMNVLCP